MGVGMSFRYDEFARLSVAGTDGERPGRAFEVWLPMGERCLANLSLQPLGRVCAPPADLSRHRLSGAGLLGLGTGKPMR